MAPRPFWKGYLKLTLVTCPVAMTPAVSEEEKIRFRTMNRRTGNPVASRYVDAVTGKVVEDDDQARGYEHAEDRYVILEDEELDAVALDSTRTIDIDVFVERDSLSPLFLDRAHYLMPDDEVGEEAFAVIRRAMEETGMAGIARLVLYRRERAVMIEPRGKGMVLWTLRYGDEVREPKDYFAEFDGERADSGEAGRLKKLLAGLERDFDPDRITDPVDESLRDIIARHRKSKPARRGRKAKTPEKASGDTNVVDIMDALRRSLGREKAGQRNSGKERPAGRGKGRR